MSAPATDAETDTDHQGVSCSPTFWQIGPWQIACWCLASVALLWLAQPPLKLWPLAFVALVPWLRLIASSLPLDRRSCLILLAVSTAYWMLSLQGLRHAHPAMYACWIALSAYLALYHLGFVWLTRRLVQRNVQLLLAAPMAWVTMELIRNYFMTGISVLMLGHTMADVTVMVQIADLAGTYGVGWVLVVVNAAIAQVLAWRCPWCCPGHRSGKQTRPAGQPQPETPPPETRYRSAVAAVAIAVVYLAATGMYGAYRIGQPAGRMLATFALLQRNEVVEYQQSTQREGEMFRNYADQAIGAVRRSSQPVDGVVWPESMFTGAAPWMILEEDFLVPDEAMMSHAEFAAAVADRRTYVQDRAKYLGQRMMTESGQSTPPHVIAGSGVIRYDQSPAAYSGILHVGPDGHVEDWYGKMHLVMFGEYIPIVPWIPGLQSLIPPGMGLATGNQPARMRVGDTVVSPNICIETAVERVTLAQVRSPTSPAVDVIVTVTNDGWFDRSSVIDHHLRCVQLVAVGCRRPVLSSANNGPTAWVDDRGRLVERLPTGVNGEIIATPTDNDRTSLYVKIGDWPIWIAAALAITMAVRRRTSHD